MNDEPVLLREPREGVPQVTDTLEGFEDYCDRLSAASGPLAADAERASGYRYGHDDWLIQFKRDGACIGLLDPMALNAIGVDWGMFNRAVGDATWILHDAKQDLPGFAQLSLTPHALFDTEIAARILGLHRFGLAYVTEHYLGMTLAKEHSAADWSYRPLPRDWRNYAALDVELLIPLAHKMTIDLKRAGKWEWACQEFEYVLRTELHPRRPHAVPWLRISHINTIQRDRRALAIAKELWTERDELARRYDIAPSLLLADSSIIEAAQAKPHNARQFRAIRSLNERVRMHLGTDQDKMFERYAPIQRKVKPSVWKQAIQRALELPEGELPVMPAPEGGATQVNAPKSMKLWQKHHPDRFRRLQACRALINQVSQDTHTPPDVLIKPQIVRNLCWTDNPGARDVAGFLEEQGARPWQIHLLAASLTRGIM